MVQNQPQRRAYVLIQVALVAVVLLGFVALTVDYGMMVVRQRRLQNVTDSAALAAGPELRKNSSIPIQVAMDYAGYNNTPGAAATVANAAITVRATENVPTPFAAVMNSAWSTRPVSARSVVQASLDVNSLATRMRPVAIQAGLFGPSGVDRFLGQPAHLNVVLASNGTGYSNNSGDQATVTADMVPMDLSATGIADTPAAVTAAIAAYKTSLKGGLQNPLTYDLKGGTYWLAAMMFVPPVLNQINWPEDLALWRKATYEAIESDELNTDLSSPLPSVMHQAEAYKNSSTPDMPDVADPRFCVFIEGNRTTGTVRKDFDMALGGYVGFFITGMDDPATTLVPQIHGQFISPVTRSRLLPPSDAPLPPVSNYGVYTYDLVQ